MYMNHLKTARNIVGASVLVLATTFSAQAQDQETAQEGYNPNSIRPIHESDQLYKTRVWATHGSSGKAK